MEKPVDVRLGGCADKTKQTALERPEVGFRIPPIPGEVEHHIDVLQKRGPVSHALHVGPDPFDTRALVPGGMSVDGSNSKVRKELGEHCLTDESSPATHE